MLLIFNRAHIHQCITTDKNMTESTGKAHNSNSHMNLNRKETIEGTQRQASPSIIFRVITVVLQK